jgi:hypothetical protein
VDAEGSLTTWTIPYGVANSEVIVRLAGESYFLGDLSDSCVLIGTFNQEPSAALPTFDAQPLFLSYEGGFELRFTDCESKLMPVWGPDGYDIINAIDGMRLGIGIGNQTDALFDLWPEKTGADLEPSMLALYVAVTGPDGTFAADAWGTALAWEWDPSTDGPLLDELMLLNPLDVSRATAPDDPLPEMYISTVAQVFPILTAFDFTRW